jgi:hypothetical protein
MRMVLEKTSVVGQQNIPKHPALFELGKKMNKSSDWLRQVPPSQIVEKTGKSVPSVKHRYRESLRNLWNQSPPTTQEGFSMGQVFALPRQGRPGPKKG